MRIADRADGLPAIAQSKNIVYTDGYTSVVKRNTMFQTRMAKLFKNGASQAVRLPAEFRFKGKELYMTQDARTGNVVLSNHPGIQAWQDFFELTHTIDIPQDFMNERPLNIHPQKTGLFDDEKK